MPSVPPIAENLARLRAQIATACDQARRDPAEVHLMAVSKTHPASAILEAYAAGQRLFGENRVQEVQAKSLELASLADLDMHLIGPLQSNKSARAAELFSAVDTLDSLKLATRLHAAAAALDKRLRILIEIKLSPEDTKHGLPPADLSELLAGIRELPNVEPRGLLTVPPFTEDPELARPYFSRLRELRDQHRAACPTLTELSMGMSHDYAIAIQEGATTVRLGTAIFGSRGTP